jgi:hypothetical protein
MKISLRAIKMVPAWRRFGLIGGNSDESRGEVPIAKLQRTEEDTRNQP